ncbi:MAG: hypothetical protein ACE5JM_00855 [Armatimonadota bacterium]
MSIPATASLGAPLSIVAVALILTSATSAQVIEDFEAGIGRDWRAGREPTKLTTVPDAAVGKGAGRIEFTERYTGWKTARRKIATPTVRPERISLWLKGEGTWALVDFFVTVEGVGRYRRSIIAPPHWQHYSFPWSAFRPWGPKQPLDPERLAQVEFKCVGRTQAFLVDHIELEAGPKEDGTGSQASGRRHTVIVDAGKDIGPCDHFWAGIGYDGMYAETFNTKLAGVWADIERNRPFRYIRCHNMFSDGTPGWSDQPFGCRIYSEDADGTPRYNFEHLDRVLDRFMELGLKPIMETDFMPDALAADPTKRNYGGGSISPPKDYRKWRDLVHATVKHCIERYGRDEVRSWWWEIWNEPDLWWLYWHGEKEGHVEDLCTLYDYFVDGALAADEGIRVGGPAIAGFEDLVRGLLEHCTTGTNAATGQTGTRIDFVSWHGYSGTPPLFAKALSIAALVQSYPELEGIELQHNEYGMGLHKLEALTSYGAASLAKYIDGLYALRGEGVTIGPLVFWGISGHCNFDPKPDRYTHGLTLTHGGARFRKPIFGAYEMLGRLGDTRIAVMGPRFGERIGAFATRRGREEVAVVVYNCDDEHPLAEDNDIEVTVQIRGLPAGRESAVLRHYRIDAEHCNSRGAWIAQGRPSEEDITEEQIATIQQAQQLQLLEPERPIAIDKGGVTLRIAMPVNSVSLLVVGPTQQ